MVRKYIRYKTGRKKGGQHYWIKNFKSSYNLDRYWKKQEKLAKELSEAKKHEIPFIKRKIIENQKYIDILERSEQLKECKQKKIRHYSSKPLSERAEEEELELKFDKGKLREIKGVMKVGAMKRGRIKGRVYEALEE